jgi:hypothetical protein
MFLLSGVALSSAFHRLEVGRRFESRSSYLPARFSLSLRSIPISTHLTSSLPLEQVYLEDLRFSFESRFLPIELTHCFNCLFYHCRNSGGSGGALSSPAPVFLRNCHFFNCSAHKGGSVASSSFLGVSQCRFAKSKGTESGVFLLQSQLKFLLNDTVIDHCRASNHGVSKRFDGDPTAISVCNFTHVKVDNQIACFEFGQCSPHCQFAVFEAISSHGRNEMLSIWQSSKAEISDVVFANITTKSMEGARGIVFWLDGSLLNCEIARCQFRRCSSFGQKTLFMMDGASVTVENCICDGDANSFANEHRHLRIGESVRFGAVGTTPIWAGEVAGFVSVPVSERGDGWFYFVCRVLSLSAVVLLVMSNRVGQPGHPAALDDPRYFVRPT